LMQTVDKARAELRRRRFRPSCVRVIEALLGIVSGSSIPIQ